MSRIIAICGAKRSGKDILSKYIVSKYNYKKISFAEPLKNAVKALFNFNDIQVGIDEENGNGYEKDMIDKRWGISPRKALQFFGTEVMQNTINELIPKNYVISDLRFLHEYNKLKKSEKVKYLIIIKINRPSIICDIDSHISENEYINIPHDIEIINDGTIDDLTDLFDIFYEKYWE